MRVPSGMTQGEVRRRRAARLGLSTARTSAAPAMTQGAIATGSMRTAATRTTGPVACAMCKLGAKKDCC